MEKKHPNSTTFQNLLILLLTIAQYPLYGMSMKAHLPGGWYPREEKKLYQRLAYLEKKARERYPATLKNVRALIVPHAGYSYSGTVAASCFNLLSDASNSPIERVIVLAPSHSVPFHGIAIPDHAKEYKIATGTLNFDTKNMKKLTKSFPFISSKSIFNDPFNTEHSFEMECPFIEKYLSPKVLVLPLLVGYLEEKDIKNGAALLKKYITPHTLIIISSDFTHYGPQFDYMPFGPTPDALSEIQALDFKVMEQLFTPSLSGFLKTLKTTEATVCGKYPIALLLALIENNSLGPVTPHLVAYTTSQESNNTDPDSSVSYAGIAYANDTAITSFEEQSLLAYAHKILLASFIKNPEENLLLPLVTPFMKKKCGTFVTWYGPENKLRGCIGTTDSTHSLIDNVRIYAKEAAFHDSRFAPITETESLFVIPAITVLTPFKKIKSYKDIIIGVHGIVLKNNGHQAIFLPQVPLEQGWDIRTTLEQLSLKAGLPKDTWKDKNTTFEVCEGYEIK